MKWITALLVLIVAVWYVATKTTLLDRVVNKDVTNAETVIPKAEKAATRERARVNQVQAVENAGADRTVSVTMSADEVRAIWGEPNSIDHDANQNEIWKYESIGKRVVFRDGKVWEVEPF
jgi:hypothetical protein